MTKDIYSPSIAIHPGKTLEDTILSLGISQVDLAQRAGLAPKTINEIIQRKSAITPETAMKLSAVLGTSASFWNNLQRQYEETVIRLDMERNLEKEIPLLSTFTCYSDLAKWNYIEEARDNKHKVLNLLNFFGVSSLKLLPSVQAVAFRKAKNKNISYECIAAWLRCGELEAQKISTDKFNRDKLINVVDDLRKLTREDPATFSKDMIKMCASCGVAVAIVPHFKNTYVHGMTRWLNADKAMVELSLRGSYDDIFWFTFFHELGHILKHGKKEQFVEFDDKIKKKGKEIEADNFACNTLIPKHEYTKFITQQDFSDTAIRNFSKSLDISPSIVAGRLSHDYDDWIKWRHLRKKLQFKNN